MKKTAIALLAVIIMAPAASMAQDKTRSEADAKRMEMRMDRKKKMEAQKVAYLTREMDLTPKEAEVFWPVYNNYKAELEGLDGKLETMSQSRGEEGEERYKIDPRDFDRQMQTKFELERNRIDLDEQYFRHFKEVLPTDKLVKFYEADVRFKRELLQKLGSDRKEGMDAREMERRRKMGERNIKQVQPVEQKRK